MLATSTHRASKCACALFVLAPMLLSVQTRAPGYDLQTARSIDVESVEHFGITPHAIAVAHDGEILLAGEVTAARLAWMSKVNRSTGQTIWTFKLNRQGTETVLEGDWFGGSPNIVGIVEGAGGLVHVCGNLPPASVMERPRVFLARLDAHGHRESLLFLTPTVSAKDLGYFEVNTCIGWGQRVTLVGHYIARAPRSPGTTPADVPSFYWLQLYGDDDKLQWDNSYATVTKGFVPGPEGVVAIPRETRLLISATDNKVTEMLAIATDGRLLASSEAAKGAYFLVRGGSPQAVGARLFGWGPTDRWMPCRVLTVTQDLGVQSTVTAGASCTVLGRYIYGAGGGALVVFGWRQRSAWSDQASAAALFDEQLKLRKSLLVQSNDATDLGQITAAAEGTNASTFLTGRVILARRQSAPGLSASSAKDGARITAIHAEASSVR
jgi:hypothetical protein